MALRVGIVHYLNAWPLAWSFLTGRQPPGLEPVYLPPSEVADRLAAGTLDVGLLPSAELARIPGLRVVPGLCIAAEREVRSVLLVSRVPPARIRRLALDTSSRTSAVLVRLLLAERWGVEPRLEAMAPDLEAMLASNDAALLIGDAALRVDRRRFHTLDLAAAWRELTGLPFVFAVWAVREPCDAAGLAAALRASLETARVEQAALVARAAAELRLDRAEVDHYLRHNLDYELDADKGRSLEMFLACAHGRGLLPAPPGLQTLQPADPALAADG